MDNLGTLRQVWRRSLDLNIRYYSAVGQLTASYLQDLVAMLADLQTAPSRFKQQSQTQRAPTTSLHPSNSAPAPHTEPRAGVATTQEMGTLVLEGELGSQALGVFLVANNMENEVSASVTASAFVDVNGRTIEPVFHFDPETIVLAPGEQLLVRVMALIDESLEPEVRYRGEFTVLELSNSRIPIVLRRQPNKDTLSVQTSSTLAGTPKKSRARSRGGSAKTNRDMSSDTESSEKQS